MPERWWISDGPVQGGAEKILGPFESRDLALEVRRLYEAHPDAKGLTFWVSKEAASTCEIGGCEIEAPFGRCSFHTVVDIDFGDDDTPNAPADPKENR